MQEGENPELRFYEQPYWKTSAFKETEVHAGHRDKAQDVILWKLWESLSSPERIAFILIV